MKLSKILFLVGIILFIFVVILSAQVPDTLWTRTYGGSDDDYGREVQQTSDGGYIIIGCTMSFSLLNDLYLIKTNVDGETLWTETYGTGDADAGYSVQQTFDGGYIITGYTYNFGTTRDVYLAKTNTDGDTLWTKMYGGSNGDDAYSIQQTSDSGYIIVGQTKSFGAGFQDVYLIKTDSSGDTLWTKTYGGPSPDLGYCVQQTTDRGYIIVGETGSFGAGNFDVYLIRTDSLGDTIWTNTFGGIYYDEGQSVRETSDYGFIITGCKRSIDSDMEVYLIKTDSLGDTLWTKTYGGSNSDYGNSVRQTSDGGYIIAGTTQSFGSGNKDVYLIRTDLLGDTIWTKTFGGSNNDFGSSVCRTTDGGYIIAGWTNSFGAGLNDVYLIKTEPDPANIKEEETTRHTQPAKNIKVYPNPFTTAFSVKCSRISEEQKINLEIYNVSGRLIKSIPLTTRTLQLGKDLSPGVYFLKVNGKNVGKVVKVR